MDDKPAFHPDASDEQDKLSGPPPDPKRTTDLESYQPSPLPPPLESGPLGPTYHRQSHKRRIIYGTIIFALLVAAAVAYYIFSLSKTDSPIAPAGSTQGSSQSPAETAGGKISAKTKNYTSPNFNLAFVHPDDWTVVDNGGGIMTVKSPSLTLKDAAGQPAAGTVVLTIRDKSQKLTEFDKGNAIATRDSQKVAYTKPTQTQRGNTYLSYLQYATAASGLSGIYITGDNGYQKGQAIPAVDIAKVDPIITITFFDAVAKSISIAESMLDDAEFADPLKAMLQSFSIN